MSELETVIIECKCGARNVVQDRERKSGWLVCQSCHNTWQDEKEREHETRYALDEQGG